MKTNPVPVHELAEQADEANGTNDAFAGRSNAEAIDDGQASATAPRVKNKRLWVLALGTAAMWQLDPAFGDVSEMAEMIGVIACATNKTLAKDAISQMRAKAESLRKQIAPLPASALTKVIRRTEAACGSVLDKGMRMKELQASWDHFVACARARQDSHS